MEKLNTTVKDDGKTVEVFALNRLDLCREDVGMAIAYNCCLEYNGQLALLISNLWGNSCGVHKISSDKMQNDFADRDAFINEFKGIIPELWVMHSGNSGGMKITSTGNSNTVTVETESGINGIDWDILDGVEKKLCRQYGNY